MPEEPDSQEKLRQRLDEWRKKKRRSGVSRPRIVTKASRPSSSTEQKVKSSVGARKQGNSSRLNQALDELFDLWDLALRDDVLPTALQGRFAAFAEKNVRFVCLSPYFDYLRLSALLVKGINEETRSILTSELMTSTLATLDDHAFKDTTVIMLFMRLLNVFQGERSTLEDRLDECLSRLDAKKLNSRIKQHFKMVCGLMRDRFCAAEDPDERCETPVNFGGVRFAECPVEVVPEPATPLIESPVEDFDFGISPFVDSIAPIGVPRKADGTPLHSPMVVRPFRTVKASKFKPMASISPLSPSTSSPFAEATPEMLSPSQLAAADAEIELEQDAVFDADQCGSVCGDDDDDFGFLLTGPTTPGSPLRARLTGGRDLGSLTPVLQVALRRSLRGKTPKRRHGAGNVAQRRLDRLTAEAESFVGGDLAHHGTEVQRVIMKTPAKLSRMVRSERIITSQRRSLRLASKREEPDYDITMDDNITFVPQKLLSGRNLLSDLDQAGQKPDISSKPMG